MPALSSNSQNEEDVDEIEAEVNRTLFLRGLHENTTEDELYELFLQAGPLEKVSIVQNRNIAFITYKHSVSAPYAKEVFCDTKLHGHVLNIGYRTGSMHISGSQRQPRGDNRNDSYESRSSNNKPYQNRSYSTQSNYRNQSLANQQSIPMASPLAYMTGLAMQNPLIPGNMPSFGMQVQGYRSSAENREYVPQYVSFDAPPASFRGGVPINHPNHQVPLDDRRARLLEQQRYVNQSSAQRDYNSRHRR